jgi:guanylate kinase
LLNRNTETPTEINIRIRNMRKEFSIAPTYDYIVINEDWNEVPNALDIAVEQVYNIIQVAHLATSRNQELIEECIEQANQEMTNQQNA